MSAQTFSAEIGGDRLEDLDRRWAQGVGRKVRGRLAENEKSQQDAGSVLGLSQNAISRRVRGELCFSMAELGRLSMWLRVPVDQLLPHQDSNLEPAGNTHPMNYGGECTEEFGDLLTAA